MTGHIKSRLEQRMHSTIQKALDYIQEHYDSDLSMPMAADYISIPVSHFSHIFKAEVGMTFSEYLIAYRMEKARLLLESTDTRISDIAEKLRYNNLQNFIRVFKKMNGMTPGEYRTRHMKVAELNGPPFSLNAIGGPEKMLIDSDEEIRKQISLDDGTIYMFPYIRSDAVKLNATAGLIIRKDWLEKLNLEADEDKIRYIVQWMDFNYSPEGHDLFNFGIEGESYVKEGDTIKFTDTIMSNPKLTYDQALAAYAMSIMDGPMDQDSRYLDALMIFDGQNEANQVWMTADDSLLLPILRFTEDESRLNASVMNPITTYLNEMMTKFIMGQTPLSEYDKFLKTIESMGIDQIIKIHEDAYQRYQVR